MPSPVKPLANLSAIVAVCDDWGIGRAGDMVVSNRADMRHFVACTKDHTVIMGRKTLESFPGGRPLKNRRNIVVTSDVSFEREGAEIVHSIEEALAALASNEETWVIGGGQVYAALLRLCSRAEVTKNHCVRAADTFFPDLDADPAWELAASGPVQQVAAGEGDEGLTFEFCTYRRVNEGE